MAIRISNTAAEAESHGLKLLVYGQAGSGKTVLCGTTPDPENTVIISAEAGLLSLADKQIDVLVVQSIADVQEAYSYLTSADGTRYTWVCLDSISEIAEAVLAHEMEQSRDPRRAYGELSVQMLSLLRGFRDLPGRNVYMSAKMERKESDNGPAIHQPMMPGAKLGQAIPYLFDLVLALRVEKDAEGNSQRWMQTTPEVGPEYVAKDRSGKLPPFVAPSLSVIAATIAGTGTTSISTPPEK